MSSNIVIDPVTIIIVHFCIDFASELLKQIWLFTYPNGFCNPVRIHGMKINEMKSIWHWLYNNNSLSVLYELNGLTHLLCAVLPHPLTRASRPSNVPVFAAASALGLVLAETIKTCLNTKHMKAIPLRIAHLHHHNVTLSANSINPCSL
jgi:hypothetical protein